MRKPVFRGPEQVKHELQRLVSGSETHLETRQKNNKGVDQIVRMHRLICVFFVCKYSQVFTRRSS